MQVSDHMIDVACLLKEGMASNPYLSTVNHNCNNAPESIELGKLPRQPDLLNFYLTFKRLRPKMDLHDNKWIESQKKCTQFCTLKA